MGCRHYRSRREGWKRVAMEFREEPCLPVEHWLRMLRMRFLGDGVIDPTLILHGLAVPPSWLITYTARVQPIIFLAPGGGLGGDWPWNHIIIERGWVASLDSIPYWNAPVPGSKSCCGKSKEAALGSLKSLVERTTGRTAIIRRLHVGEPRAGAL